MDRLPSCTPTGTKAMQFCYLEVSGVANTWRECDFNPLNAELNPIRHLLALIGARHIVHVSRIRVNQQQETYPGGSTDHSSLYVQRQDGSFQSLVNPLKTKRRPLYLKTQFAPRSKHFSSRL